MEQPGTHGEPNAGVLAHTGLDENDASVLASMVKLLKNRTSMDWNIGSPSRADVLIVGAHADEQLLQRWQASGKVWIAALRSHESRPLTPHTLQVPIRVFPLLTLLRELEQLPQLHSPTRLAPAMVRQPSSDPRWAFGKRLRSLALSIEHGNWLRFGALYVRDDGRCYAADAATIELMRTRALRWNGDETIEARPAADCLVRPVEELAWFTGWWADDRELAPWLDPDESYRLRHWPDFGSLGGDQSQLRLAALLAARAWRFDELTQARGLTTAQVVRFLNAASLSGALIACAPAIAPPPPKPPGFIVGLVQNIRSRLGLAASAHA
jgi:hypothetical protein